MTTWKEHLVYLICPFCSYKMDRAGATNTGRGPKPSDVSICIKCGGAAIFTRKLRLRAPTTKERRELMLDDKVRHYQKAVRTVQSKKDHP